MRCRPRRSGCGDAGSRVGGLATPPCGSMRRAFVPREDRQVRDPRRGRPWRHGDRLPGARPDPRACRRAQDDLGGGGRRAGDARALSSRGALGGAAAAPEHRHRLRVRRGRRRAVHRHGVPRGRGPRRRRRARPAGGARPPARRRHPALRRARLRAPPRRHPPRRQAVEREPSQGRGGQDRRLRHRPPRGGHAGDPHRRGARDAVLHGSRAVRRRTRRPSRGPVVGGRHPLRAARRPPPVRREERPVADLRHRPLAAPQARPDGQADPSPTRRDRGARPRQGSAPALPRPRPARAGAARGPRGGRDHPEPERSAGAVRRAWLRPASRRPPRRRPRRRSSRRPPRPASRPRRRCAPRPRVPRRSSRMVCSARRAASR